VSPNATDSGAPAGDGNTPASSGAYDLPGVPVDITVPVPGAPTGAPAKVTAKQLPKGLSVAGNPNGTVTITGSASPGTGGTYTVLITEEFASDASGSTPAAADTPLTAKLKVTTTLDFTVYQPASFTSAASPLTALIGKNVKYKLKTDKKEYPRVPAFNETGKLPTGVQLTGVGNEVELTGTPGAGTEGTYPITITASNGYGTPASVMFVITVNGGSSKH